MPVIKSGPKSFSRSRPTFLEVEFYFFSNFEGFISSKSVSVVLGFAY